MPKPRFLTPDQSDQWAVLEEKLKSENNLDWLLTLICWCVRDQIFPYHSHDPLSKSPDAVLSVGHSLYSAVITKLKTSLPKDRDKDPAYPCPLASRPRRYTARAGSGFFEG